MPILITLHVLAAVVWVGGMFFAYMVLRQSVGPLEPAVRLALWHRVFRHFFPARVRVMGFFGSIGETQ